MRGRARAAQSALCSGSRPRAAAAAAPPTGSWPPTCAGHSWASAPPPPPATASPGVGRGRAPRGAGGGGWGVGSCWDHPGTDLPAPQTSSSAASACGPGCPCDPGCLSLLPVTSDLHTKAMRPPRRPPWDGRRRQQASACWCSDVCFLSHWPLTRECHRVGASARTPSETPAGGLGPGVSVPVRQLRWGRGHRAQLSRGRHLVPVGEKCRPLAYSAKPHPSGSPHLPCGLAQRGSPRVAPPAWLLPCGLWFLS